MTLPSVRVIKENKQQNKISHKYDIGMIIYRM